MSNERVIKKSCFSCQHIIICELQRSVSDALINNRHYLVDDISNDLALPVYEAIADKCKLFVEQPQ